MIDLEHQVQKAIAQYLDLRGVCYFAIPNGGKRNVISATKLKAIETARYMLLLVTKESHTCMDVPTDAGYSN
jgi:hypothetical protein